jgi:hypothetical protein
MVQDCEINKSVKRVNVKVFIIINCLNDVFSKVTKFLNNRINYSTHNLFKRVDKDVNTS